MITGFNTDIKHDGILYHVQTEDKGPENPLIISLIYVGGAILASKRTSYAKELADSISDDHLRKKLEKQHQLILALISRGRINELIKYGVDNFSVDRQTISIVINGEKREIDSKITLEELIINLNLPLEFIAVELNGVVQPRILWNKVRINANDIIEFVHFVGGGEFL